MDTENQPGSPVNRGAISVIVPVWREVAALEPLLLLLGTLPEIAETIVTFAETEPSTSQRAAALGAHCIEAGAPNRGRQLDAGAAAASGEWLLFHHADSTLTAAHVQALAALGESHPAAVGGAFYRKFDERHPAMRRFEAIERWHNRRFGPLYGDQSLFVRRAVFQELGGFRGLPLMEDVDFSLRLRRHGPLALLDPPVASSPRKHLAQGPWRTTLANALLLVLFRLGVAPARLHRWYYRAGPASASPQRAAQSSLESYPSPQPRNTVATSVASE